MFSVVRISRHRRAGFQPAQLHGRLGKSPYGAAGRLEKSSYGKARCRGFTLVELLVVIAIIGTLLALLLPAVQAVRGAAQRATCANNLHQIGVGLQNYHATHRRFPPGGVEPISPKWPKGRQLAWSAFLLPFLEQADLHSRIDFSKPFNAPENAAAAAQFVPVYVCPSVSRNFDPARDRAPTDYGGIYGERITSPNNPPKGMMLYDRPLSMRDARDGTSTTLIIGEAGGWPDGQWINGLNIFDQAFPINQAPAFENDMSSKHPGGAHGLFCDGNARFLSETMDSKTLAAICTRDGGEVVEEF